MLPLATKTHLDLEYSFKSSYAKPSLNGYGLYVVQIVICEEWHNLCKKLMFLCTPEEMRFLTIFY